MLNSLYSLRTRCSPRFSLSKVFEDFASSVVPISLSKENLSISAQLSQKPLSSDTLHYNLGNYFILRIFANLFLSIVCGRQLPQIHADQSQRSPNWPELQVNTSEHELSRKSLILKESDSCTLLSMPSPGFCKFLGQFWFSCLPFNYDFLLPLTSHSCICQILSLAVSLCVHAGQSLLLPPPFIPLKAPSPHHQKPA